MGHQRPLSHFFQSYLTQINLEASTADITLNFTSLLSDFTAIYFRFAMGEVGGLFSQLDGDHKTFNSFGDDI